MGINVVAMAEEDDVEKAIAMSLVDRPDGSPGSRQRKRNTKDWDVDASEARSESFSPDRGLMVKLAVPCLCLVFLWLVMSNCVPGACWHFGYFWSGELGNTFTWT